jgi:hypothetical protein
MKYHHYSIPTETPQSNEVYVEAADVYVTNPEENPYGIMFVRCGKNCNLPKIVKEKTHICFFVDNMEEAIEGKEVVLGPRISNAGNKNIEVAIINENGVLIEFMKYISSDHTFAPK